MGCGKSGETGSVLVQIDQHIIMQPGTKQTAAAILVSQSSMSLSAATAAERVVNSTRTMWNVEDLETVPVELDFSSSGQGRRSATAIETGGVRLFNAIELIDVEATATQVEVCECCGVPHCSPGGWVAFRRIGDRVVWIPAWDRMETGSWEQGEYKPPSFLGSKGAPVFGSATWERLRDIHGSLPAREDLLWINSRETARLCQWSAPGRLLGEYPAEPRMRRDLLIAVTDGDLAPEASELDTYLQAQFGAVRRMAIVPSNAAVKPIEFWLDLPGTPSWTSFGHVGSNLCFLVDGNVALVRDDGITNG